MLTLFTPLLTHPRPPSSLPLQGNNRNRRCGSHRLRQVSAQHRALVDLQTSLFGHSMR